MTNATIKTTITCELSGKTVEAKQGKSGAILPRGWKRHDGATYSPEAWHTLFSLRAITFIVASPGDELSWDDLRKCLVAAWSRSTQLANWAVQRLMQLDVVRDETMTKLPPMPKVYLYGERTFDGWSNSAAAILHAVEAKYRQTRYQRIWLGKTRLPDTRYPYPYPLQGANYRCHFDDGNRPLVTLSLGSRITIRLRGGPRYRRQLVAFRQIVEGQAIQAEASIMETRGDEREIRLKIVAWIPRVVNCHTDGTLYVRTDSQSAWIGLDDTDQRLFIINGDRMRRWATQHNRWLQRFREDQKMEIRKPNHVRKKWQRDMTTGVDKYHRRLDSFVKESAAQIANFAQRRRLAMIRYDDNYVGYFHNFPWFEFRSRLATLCDEKGITFDCVSGDVVQKTKPPLASS